MFCSGDNRLRIYIVFCTFVARKLSMPSYDHVMNLLENVEYICISLPAVLRPAHVEMVGQLVYKLTQ